MSILDRAKVGDSVQVNLELTKERFAKEVIDTINLSPIGKISGFKITDGKGIGVVLQLCDGKEQWFFEDEIDLLDEKGKVIKKIQDNKDNKNIIFKALNKIDYQNKKNIGELLNPINFFFWLFASIKDNF
tara:strand:- start:664 stop:1053 length:390 start_codon:yes stop_codon:yes gene_type:complete